MSETSTPPGVDQSQTRWLSFAVAGSDGPVGPTGPPKAAETSAGVTNAHGSGGCAFPESGRFPDVPVQAAHYFDEGGPPRAGRLKTSGRGGGRVVS